MLEIWKKLKDFPRYSVSDQGRVRNDESGDYLKPWNNGKRNPYFYVELWNDEGMQRYRLHRLIAEAFIPNPHTKPSVNHKDGDPRNNSVDNLEWATVEENNLWNDFLTFQRVLRLFDASRSYSPDELLSEARNRFTPSRQSPSVHNSSAIFIQPLPT